MNPNIGFYAAIDIESGAYEVDRDDLAATDGLLSRHPDAQIWVVRIGYPYVDRIGSAHLISPAS